MDSNFGGVGALGRDLDAQTGVGVYFFVVVGRQRRIGNQGVNERRFFLAIGLS